jgi:hypothetical protein
MSWPGRRGGSPAASAPPWQPRGERPGPAWPHAPLGRRAEGSAGRSAADSAGRCRGASGNAGWARPGRRRQRRARPRQEGPVRRRAPRQAPWRQGAERQGAEPQAGQASAATADAEARGAGAAGAWAAGVQREGWKRQNRQAPGQLPRRHRARRPALGGVCKPRASVVFRQAGGLRGGSIGAGHRSWPCPCLASSVGGAGSANAVAYRREAA